MLDSTSTPARAMRILAIDAATRTGIAIGNAGEKPRVTALRLKKPDEDYTVAWFNMACYLRDLFVLDKPDLIALEAPMHPAAQRSPDAVVLQWGVACAVLIMARFYELRLEFCKVDNVRKHFTGRSRWKDRKEAKTQTISRCHQLGYLPSTCKDEDMADACAIFDYASARFAKVQPKVLQMFGAGA